MADMKISRIALLAGLRGYWEWLALVRQHGIDEILRRAVREGSNG